jgi:hypothetical protein
MIGELLICIFKIAAQREFGFLTGNFLLAWAGQFAGIKKSNYAPVCRAGCIFSLLLNAFEWRLRFKI